MPYANGSPLKDVSIRKMIVLTCYAEIALAANEWSPYRLERNIDSAKSATKKQRYWRLLRGIVPQVGTVKEYERKLGDHCQILKWRDHPFWKLLKTKDLTHNDIYIALNSVRSNVYHHIWHDPPMRDRWPNHRLVREKVDKQLIQHIAKYKNFDALLTLLAFAREGRDSGMGPQFATAALHSLEIFPYVVTRHPQLYICWKLLAARLIKLIWKPNPVFTKDISFNVSVASLGKKIRPLAIDARDRGIQLPTDNFMKKYT